MPIKYKESEVVVNRTTKKKATKNYYIHTIATDELQKTLANEHTRGPRKQKIRNELVRRKEPLVEATSEA